MKKQFIAETPRLQQLAGIIIEAQIDKVKNLYEQPEANSNKSLKVDSLAGFPVREFIVTVNLEDDSNDDVYVVISVNEGGRFLIKSITTNGDDELSDEAVRDYVNDLIQSGYFDSIPEYLTYDLETQKLDSV
jgi:outer membrane protein assembly factor BamA